MAVDDRAVRRLSEIAAVMGCRVEVFYLPDSEAHEAGMTCELLRLWNAITEPQARQRILASARLEARGAARVETVE
ncbi:hypothetical protein GOFOIKOB_1422 [Methylobacterium tardum]|jgi:hypothetical protein|uniref:Uncharacterized protein n=1 Tax=Methylobacterium tardum TaxID=374432 RepID=A0AA37WW54_9HYPH|nr:hypothetical protein [Methylobacterium tardum]URD34558.1 hypothetical protein M6G65_18335 [Methylobacterium tardum]GJE48393.1 hypothetical protein GOFOIKOB_1422 [Methylobacterium tardum]GLS73003.1 hypothetical protein GCM10007890_50180 [Methylobacterium tardum]